MNYCITCSSKEVKFELKNKPKTEFKEIMLCANPKCYLEYLSHFLDLSLTKN